MRSRPILLAAVVLVAVVSTTCAPAVRPQPRWQTTFLTVQAAPGTPDIDQLDLKWLESELVLRGIVGDAAGPAVITVESLKGVDISAGEKYYFKGSILWTKTGKSAPLLGEGQYRSVSVPYLVGPRARADAIRKAVCLAAGAAI
ncbi:MAG: hypothetical protein PHU25_00895 [Deltaproteobacteria bacterium]|nr:hypothetical protein [Deltaproteobacteria bacterium]